MGRGRRICYPGAFFHCINRGNRREKLFWDENDYEQMLKCLGETSERYGVRIHGFCLIPNHFHLLLQQQEQSVSSAMRSLGTNYATYFNRKYHKVGHVFQGRFRGILCDKQTYLMALIRYIHLNPVRAGLVERVEDWPWSSLRAYLGLSKWGWLYKQDVMAMLGRQARKRLLELLAQTPGLSREQIYPAEELSIMGSQEFIEQVSHQGEPRRGRRRVYTGQKLPLRKLGEILCQAAGISLSELLVRHKGSHSKTAVRDRMVHAATRMMFYPGAEVARFLGVTTASVTLANHRFDVQQRQNPKMENGLVELLMKNS